MGSAVALALALVAAGPPPLERPPRVATASSRLYRILWSKPLLSRGLMEYKPLEPAGPAVDPVTGLVVAGTRDGRVHAFQADGSRLWEFQAAAGFKAAPLITGDTVYAGSLDGRLYALEKATGKERWRYEAREELGCQPVLWGGLVYVATLQETVLALDARTGAWKWHYRRDSSGGFTIRGVAQLTVEGGRIYQGFADGSVAALDAKTGAVRWERRVAPKGDFMDVDGIALDGGRLFAAAYSGLLVALDPATGKTLWEVKAPQACRVVASRGFLAAVAGGRLVALRGPNGKEIWSAPFEGTPAEAPVALPGLVLVPHTRGLLFIDSRDGKELRDFTRGAGFTAAPAVANGRFYALSNAAELVAAELTGR